MIDDIEVVCPDCGGTVSASEGETDCLCSGRQYVTTSTVSDHIGYCQENIRQYERQLRDEKAEFARLRRLLRLFETGNIKALQRRADEARHESSRDYCSESDYNVTDGGW